PDESPSNRGCRGWGFGPPPSGILSGTAEREGGGDLHGQDHQIPERGERGLRGDSARAVRAEPEDDSGQNEVRAGGADRELRSDPARPYEPGPLRHRPAAAEVPGDEQRDDGEKATSHGDADLGGREQLRGRRSAEQQLHPWHDVGGRYERQHRDAGAAV